MRKHFKSGTLTAPLPPVLVTVGDGQENNVITIAWTGILCTHPPKTYISVRPSRHSHAHLLRTREFVIHLPTEQLAREVDFIGIYTGAKVDKFEACHLTRVESHVVDVPTIAECPLALECRVTDVYPMGSHDVFIADIVSISCDEQILDKNGKIRLDRAHLLAYAHGEYFGLGRRLGSFGFSTKKSTRGGRSAPKYKKEKRHE